MVYLAGKRGFSIIFTLLIFGIDRKLRESSSIKSDLL